MQRDKQGPHGIHSFTRSGNDEFPRNSLRSLGRNRRGGTAGVFSSFYPKPGWVEHDPTEILTSQMSCAVQALVRAGIEAHDVTALGITNQRETVIVWDRETGQPVYKRYCLAGSSRRRALRTAGGGGR